ncbi:hypothetical protein [Clostridium botulinum]|uniref:hypothetical protein n=1 Tax=Clostridium botulinum TaxID=1491 RepID=UPI001C9A7709|nr:hypothetical protein [Clostridium botulinum]MBY6809007.1 hypothetical protein [Clostridium botulinum]MBY6822288.1 hypothetical protein [Clostridium botulinum]MBY6832922.1 hypothetical protein [Clostridium botulinum]MBY6972150.1 hypothetical protein [Clostridium botulinum]HBJ1649385.1 hypothetical protein [Clostridium botulinum]
MTRQEKIQYIKENYGVTYSFIAEKIGTYKQNFYKFMLPTENEQYRDLTINQSKKLDVYLSKYFK